MSFLQSLFCSLVEDWKWWWLLIISYPFFEVSSCKVCCFIYLPPQPTSPLPSLGAFFLFFFFLVLFFLLYSLRFIVCVLASFVMWCCKYLCLWIFIIAKLFTVFLWRICYFFSLCLSLSRLLISPLFLFWLTFQSLSRHIWTTTGVVRYSSICSFPLSISICLWFSASFASNPQTSSHKTPN